jgi:hypothetical protein
LVMAVFGSAVMVTPAVTLADFCFVSVDNCSVMAYAWSVVDVVKAGKEACRKTSNKAFRQFSLTVLDILNALDVFSIIEKRKSKRYKDFICQPQARVTVKESQ